MGPTKKYDDTTLTVGGDGTVSAETFSQSDRDSIIKLFIDGPTETGYRSIRGFNKLVYLEIGSSVGKIGDQSIQANPLLAEIKFLGNIARQVHKYNLYDLASTSSIYYCSSIPPEKITTETILNPTGKTYNIYVPSNYSSNKFLDKDVKSKDVNIIADANKNYTFLYNTLIISNTDIISQSDVRIMSNKDQKTKCNSCGFENIESIIIQDNVKKIGEAAFESCSKLSKVSISGSVSLIYSYAFKSCPALTRLDYCGTTDPANSGSTGYFDGSNFASTKLFVKSNYLGDTFCGITVANRDSNVILKLDDGRYWLNLTVHGTKLFISPGQDPPCAFVSQAYVREACSKEFACGSCGGYSKLTSVHFSEGIKYLGKDAFLDCTSLTVIESIPNSIEEFKERVFKNCNKLNCELNFKSSMKFIKFNAFDGCSSLVGPVTINSPNFDRIEDYAFNQCSSLERITFPDSLVTIGQYAFYNCNSLNSLALPPSLTILGSYSFTSCSSISGAIGFSITKVTSLNENAFDSCSKVERIILGNQITSVGSYSFVHCDSLTEIDFGASITIINPGAFMSCRSLINLSFPASIQKIYEFAFMGCSKLTTIITCTTVNPGADSTNAGQASSEQFSGCLIGKVVVPNGYNIRGGFCDINAGQLTDVSGDFTEQDVRFIFKGSELTVSSVSSTVVTRNIVKTVISRYVDPCSGSSGFETITALTIESGITSIGDSAFKGFSGLSMRLIIPPSVESIGQSCFEGCSSIIGELDIMSTKITVISRNSFKGCSKISSLKLPKSISIESEAFSWCQALKDIFYCGETDPRAEGSSDQFLNSGMTSSNLDVVSNYLGDTFCGIQVISRNANVIMQEDAGYYINLTIIGTELHASAGKDPLCDTLKQWHVRNACLSTYKCCSCGGFKKLTAVHINEGIKYIEKKAFISCEQLNCPIQFKRSLISIGSDAFTGCRKLAGPISFNSPNFESSVEIIGQSCFEGCSSITGELDLENTAITVLNQRVFKGCSGIISLKLPSHLLTINDEAFSGCSSLSNELILPSSLSSIGNSAFESCSAIIGTINFNSTGIKRISTSSFKNCSKIEKVEMNDKIESIGEFAFFGCVKLAKLAIGSSIIEIEPSSFQETAVTSLTLPEKTEKIKESAFKGCVSLANIELGINLKEIGSSSFENTGLKSVVLPLSLVQINASAFCNCLNLASVTFAEVKIKEGTISLKVIEESAFKDCTSLQKVEIGQLIEKISDYTFENTIIDSIKLPSTLKEIGVRAFANTEIETIYIPYSVTKIYPEAFINNANLKFVDYCGLEDPAVDETNQFNGCDKLKSVGVADLYKVSSFFCGKPVDLKYNKVYCNIPSNTFSASAQFTPTPTEIFSLSKQFVSSDGFSKTQLFKQSSHFSRSQVFSRTQTFSISKEFTKTHGFSTSESHQVSSKFSSSELHQVSKKFTKTHDFSSSKLHQVSKKFTKTHDFSSSKLHQGSNKFSSSRDFTFTKVFSKSSKFSMTNKFEASQVFSLSSKFSASILFENQPTTTEAKDHVESSLVNPTTIAKNENVATTIKHEAYDQTSIKHDKTAAQSSVKLSEEVQSSIKQAEKSFLLIQSNEPSDFHENIIDKTYSPSRTGTIVGSLVGAIAAIVIIIALVIYLKSRKKSQSASSMNFETTEMDSTEYFNEAEIFTEIQTMTQDMAFTNPGYNDDALFADGFEEMSELHL